MAMAIMMVMMMTELKQIGHLSLFSRWVEDIVTTVYLQALNITVQQKFCFSLNYTFADQFLPKTN